VEDQPDFEFFEPSSSLQLAVPMKRNYYMHVWRNIMEKMPHYKAIAHRNKVQILILAFFICFALYGQYFLI
jgi:hypothetical protein